MSELLKNIDARTKLAGTNKLEILRSFSRRRSAYRVAGDLWHQCLQGPRGDATPAITAAPDMPRPVEGMVSLRGALVPVIDFAGTRAFRPTRRAKS